MKHFLAVPVFVLLMLASCSSAPPKTSTKDIESIRAAEMQANADWKSRDLERIARFWAEDGSLLIPGEPAIRGKAAIKTALRQMLADPQFNLTLSTATTKVAGSGDIGYTTGTAMLTVTDPGTKKVINVPYNYVTIFHKQADGAWLAVEDIATTDRATVVAKPSASAPAKASKRGKASKNARKKAAKKRRR